MKDIQPEIQANNVRIVPIYLPDPHPVQTPFQNGGPGQQTPFQHIPFTGIPQEPATDARGFQLPYQRDSTSQMGYRASFQTTHTGSPPVYIPAYYLEYPPQKLQRKEPGVGETLMGCGILLLVGIIGIAVLYFLSASAM